LAAGLLLLAPAGCTTTPHHPSVRERERERERERVLLLLPTLR
jgi:hypothetical protein